jgi:hypothetical protein
MHEEKRLAGEELGWDFSTSSIDFFELSIFIYASSVPMMGLWLFGISVVTDGMPYVLLTVTPWVLVILSS